MSGNDRLSVMMLTDVVSAAGGAERFATTLALRLDPERFDRTICVSRWSEERAANPAVAAILEELDEAGVEVVGLRRRSRFAIGSWRPLARRLRAGGVDVLHAHKFGSNVWGAILGTLARTPVIVAHEQTWSYEGEPLRRFLDRELIGRFADAFICVSSEDRRRMIEIEGVDPGKIVMVPNAIAAHDGTGEAVHELRGRLGIDADAPVIGAVCVLRDQKRLDVLLRASALIAKEFPRLRVLLVGDGPERAALEAIRHRLGLEEVVTFLGERSDVPELLTVLDVAVLSSAYEGTPLAVMEYMGAGLPIVATRVGGVPDLIDDGVHGLLVPPDDPEAFAGAVCEQLRDRTRALEMGQRARERQRLEFDLDVAVDRIAELYEELYARSARGDRQAGAAAH